MDCPMENNMVNLWEMKKFASELVVGSFVWNIYQPLYTHNLIIFKHHAQMFYDCYFHNLSFEKTCISKNMFRT